MLSVHSSFINDGFSGTKGLKIFPKEPTPKIGQKKSPVFKFTNTWGAECSGAGESVHGSGRGVARRSKRQRQRVTIWSGCPA